MDCPRCTPFCFDSRRGEDEERLVERIEAGRECADAITNAQCPGQESTYFGFFSGLAISQQFPLSIRAYHAAPRLRVEDEYAGRTHDNVIEVSERSSQIVNHEEAVWEAG